MKKVIVGCLVLVMMFMVGCTSSIQDLENIRKRFPNGEIFGLSDQKYLVRTSSNEVFIAVGNGFEEGGLNVVKIFNARSEFVSPDSQIK